MKYALTSLLFICCFSAAVNAQSFVALQTQSGRYLRLEAERTPPSNEVTAAQLATAVSLKIMQQEKLVPAEGYTVASYRMTVIGKAGKMELQATSEIITPEMTKELEKLQPGDKVYFEYIKGSLVDGTKIELPALDFKIRE